MIDTGAEASLICESIIDDKFLKTISDQEIIEIRGFANGTILSLGIIYGDLDVDNVKLYHKFHVIPKGFIPETFDVILGQDFLHPNRFSVNYEDKGISLSSKKLKIINKNLEGKYVINNKCLKTIRKKYGSFKENKCLHENVHNNKIINNDEKIEQNLNGDRRHSNIRVSKKKLKNQNKTPEELNSSVELKNNHKNNYDENIFVPNKTDKVLIDPLDSLDQSLEFLNKTKIVKEIQNIGIKNYGLNCGVNSILQAILRIDAFQSILSKKPKNENLGDLAICRALQQLLNDFLIEKEIIDPKIFIDALTSKYKELNFNKQQDAHEIYKRIEETLIECMQFNSTNGLMSTNIKCESCKFIINKNEKFTDISIRVDKNSVQESLDDFFVDKIIENYKCNSCNNCNVVMSHEVVESPDILCVQLKRFSGNCEKLDDKINYDEYLILNKNSQYKLKSMVCHDGNYNSGHYVAVKVDERNYYLFNDENVSSFNKKLKEINSGSIYLLFYEKIKNEKIKKNLNLLPNEFYSETNQLIIPARTKKLINIEMEGTGSYLCKNKTLENGLIVGNSLTEIKNNKGIITLLNNTETDLAIHELNLELEPLKSYNVLTFNNKIQNVELDRISKLKDIIDMENLNSDEKENLYKIIEEFNDVFHLEDDKLSVCELVEHEIPIYTDSPVINVRPYRLPILQREEIERQIDKMLTDGLIVESKSPWNAPLLLVPKKTEENKPKKWRLVVDFRRLNEITVGCSFPLPLINEILNSLANAKFFSILDMSQGFHQIGMSKESQKLTAFSTSSNHYEWKRMPMGLKSATHTFQRLVNSVLTGLNGAELFVYLDDIVVFSSTMEEHMLRITKVLQRLRENKLKLQPEKCKFLQKEVIYLGHLISETGISVDPNKFKAIKDFPIPNKVKQIKSFLGMMGFYRRFIPNFANIAKPLTNLLKKGEKFIWTNDCDESFNLLKLKLISKPILQYPDFSKEFCLTTDASKSAIGAVLSQKDNEQNDLPCGYASRVLNDAESRYSTTERELLAFVWGVEHFNVYLYGRKFLILSDHKPLKWLMNVKDPKSRLIRWKLRLSKYDFEIQHIKGKSNHVADCLSRNVGTIKIKVITRSAVKRDKNIEKNITSEEHNHKIRDHPNKYETTNVKNKKSNNKQIVEDNKKIITRSMSEKNKNLNNSENLKFNQTNKLKNIKDKSNNIINDAEMDICVHIPKIIETEDRNLIKNNCNRIRISSLENENDENSNKTLNVGDLIILVKSDKKEFVIINKLNENDQIDIKSLKKSFIELLQKLDKIEENQFFYILKHEISNKALELENVKKLIIELFDDKNIFFIILDETKKILTDRNDIDLILKEYHQNPLGGHQGIKRMLSRIKDKFSWDHMKQTVIDYVGNCKSCQINKYSLNHKMPLQITSTAKKPFEKISIDIVGPLPETSEGYKYILTFQDNLTKFVGAIPIKNQETDTVARAFVNHIILKFGFRENLSILSDNGSNFQSQLFKKVCKLLKIKKIYTSPYAPFSNGSVERFHRTLKEQIRNYIENVNEWSEYVEFVVFTINSTKTETTGYSPFELVFGYKIHVPTSLTGKVDPIYNYDDYAIELKYKLQKAHEIARHNQLLSKEKTKSYYDRKIRPIKFKEGDLVLMKNHLQKGDGRKLQPLFIGPYLVTEIVSETNVKIKIKNGEKIVHNNNLKLYKENN